ncbi:MAG: lysophospholipid acyltransferase family protein [Bacteroidota bacterium]
MAKNVFGQSLWIKKKVFQIIGYATRKRFLDINDISVSGSSVLLNIPDKNVLFVVNHQTIFTDVVAIFHVFFATLNGQIDSIKKLGYLKNPKLNVYYIAARETMEKGILPKILAMAGAVSIDRTWRKGDEMVQRAVNPDDTKQIAQAIADGWVITFPQGTTRKGAPVRKGTAQLILKHKPRVIPIRVDGFRDAFDKTGLKIINKGIQLSIKIGSEIRYDGQNAESLTRKIAEAIGESN